MKLSQRMDQLAPYLFVEINKKIAEKRARGEEVISFGIGDPDIPTPPISSKSSAKRPATRPITDTPKPTDCRHCARPWLPGTSGGSK